MILSPFLLSPLEAALRMFLGKRILKMCCKFTERHPYQNMTEVYNSTLLKSHFGMVFSCKFAAHFRARFPKKGWRAGPAP